MHKWRSLIPGAVLSLLLLVGCGNKEIQPPQILASNSIVADIVRIVAGDQYQVQTIVPRGADPHMFEPTPKSMQKLRDAELIFINGLGLENSMKDIFNSAGVSSKLVPVSSEISPLEMNTRHDDHVHASTDPHVWLNPRKVISWVKVIEQSLAAYSPEQSELFKQNASACFDSLMALDSWILDKISEIPRNERKLVSDHLMFGYFCEQYGFSQEGSILPGFSSMASPSAKDIAAIQRKIHSSKTRAVVINKGSSPTVAERVAEDAGVNLVPIHAGSLGEAGGNAETYFKMMRSNVNAIVKGLK